MEEENTTFEFSLSEKESILMLMTLIDHLEFVSMTKEIRELCYALGAHASGWDNPYSLTHLAEREQDDSLVNMLRLEKDYDHSL